ncbi:MAG TPA: PH domain-containing protein [Candidatus Dormibacteraeota bacterium]|nr:PH domain-containing protein [Candidatus Dormibacteraeota bacterium]
MSAAPSPSVLPVDGQWRRLSPLSPVVRGGAALLGVLVVLPNLVANGVDPRRAGDRIVAGIVAAALLCLSVVGAVVSWLVTRWRIAGGNLQIETGLVRRQSFRVPLTRIQAVDVVAPLTARLVGVAEVRIVSAGRGQDRARLAYVRSDEAHAIRSQLLALAHGLTAETPEPPAYPLLQVPGGRLAGSLALRSATLIPLLAVVGLLWATTASPGGAARALEFSFGSLVAALALHVVAVAQAFNADFDFRISEAPDGFRLDRGMLQTRHETIPFGRIQAVRLVEPLLWRPLGWCRLDVDVARQRVSRRADQGAHIVSRTLLPVAPREQVLWLLARVTPHAQPSPPPGSRVPRRAWVKAPLSRHLLAAWHDERYLCARTGRLTAATVVLPLAKLQSLRLSSGPLQRALGLATLRGVSAGQRWAALAHCRDAQEAGAWLWTLIDRARAARRAPSPWRDLQAGVATASVESGDRPQPHREEGLHDDGRQPVRDPRLH